MALVGEDLLKAQYAEEYNFRFYDELKALIETDSRFVIPTDRTPYLFVVLAVGTDHSYWASSGLHQWADLPKEEWLSYVVLTYNSEIPPTDDFIPPHYALLEIENIAFHNPAVAAAMIFAALQYHADRNFVEHTRKRVQIWSR